MHGVLHKAIDQAVRWNLVTRNVADLVDPRRRSSKEVSALSPSEALRLLAAARGERLEGLYALAITGGDGGESVSHNSTPKSSSFRIHCSHIGARSGSAGWPDRERPHWPPRPKPTSSATTARFRVRFAGAIQHCLKVTTFAALASHLAQSRSAHGRSMLAGLDST